LQLNEILPIVVVETCVVEVSVEVDRVEVSGTTVELTGIITNVEVAIDELLCMLIEVVEVVAATLVVDVLELVEVIMLVWLVEEVLPVVDVMLVSTWLPKVVVVVVLILGDTILAVMVVIGVTELVSSSTGSKGVVSRNSESGISFSKLL